LFTVRKNSKRQECQRESHFTSSFLFEEFPAVLSLVYAAATTGDFVQAIGDQID